MNIKKLKKLKSSYFGFFFCLQTLHANKYELVSDDFVTEKKVDYRLISGKQFAPKPKRQHKN